MEQALDLFMNQFVIFLLVFVRMTSLFIITPIFGRQNMPSYLKIGLSAFTAYIIAPILGNVQIDYINLVHFSVIVFKELFVGIVIGYVSFVVFSAMFSAGQMIDSQIGFGMINVLDPQSNIQVPLIGNFLYIFAVLCFLLADGHHILFSAIVKSYSIVPINSFFFTKDLINNLIGIFAETFATSLKIAFPIVAAALIAEVSLGILSRTVPQMNVFMVGMPMKIALGLLALIFLLPGFSNILDYLFDSMYGFISIVIQSMTKG